MLVVEIFHRCQVDCVEYVYDWVASDAGLSVMVFVLVLRKVRFVYRVGRGGCYCNSLVFGEMDSLFREIRYEYSERRCFDGFGDAFRGYCSISTTQFGARFHGDETASFRRDVYESLAVSRDGTASRYSDIVGFSANELSIQRAVSGDCDILIGATVSSLVARIGPARDPMRRTRSAFGSIDFT